MSYTTHEVSTLEAIIKDIKPLLYKKYMDTFSFHYGLPAYKLDSPKRMRTILYHINKIGQSSDKDLVMSAEHIEKIIKSLWAK